MFSLSRFTGLPVAIQSENGAVFFLLFSPVRKLHSHFLQTKSKVLNLLIPSYREIEDAKRFNFYQKDTAKASVLADKNNCILC